MKRYGSYHRVSQVNGRDTEAENYITEKEAWKRIEGWAAASGGKVTVSEEDRYLDRDQTGSKLSRPAFDRMLDDLRSGKIDGIAVAYTDRLSRAKTGDALRTIDEILAIAPGQLALLDLGVDPTTETGELLLTVLLALGRMQWRQYQRRWSTARSEAIERGVWIGPDPFGYRKTVIDWTKDGEPIHGPLEPDDNAPIVREAYRVAAGEGLYAAMRYLSEAAPGKRWRTDEARRLLSSRVYLGETFHGECRNVSAHEPLTTFDRFAAVQALPEMTSRPKRSNGDYALSGIPTCGKCGSYLVGAMQTVRGRKYRRYRCSNVAVCRGGSSIRAEKLEGYVRDRVGVVLGARAVTVSHDPATGLEEARREVELAKFDLERWSRDHRARDVMGDDAWYAGLETCTKALEWVEAKEVALASQSMRMELLPAIDELGDPEQLVRAIRAVVKAIVVKPGRGKVTERVDIEWTEVDATTSSYGPFYETASEKTIEAGMKALTEGARRRILP